eukprot:TRINITY_DN5181_c0_g1_i2.p2 TRINITY_DN5181_c0_g1~~TRINITY_DN5181_c0_g1_i2.p2  ORF type:complete len:109 (-),score=37.09 TRINITY_DN5181_c0_g1_i2:12-338(-)
MSAEKSLEVLMNKKYDVDEALLSLLKNPQPKVNVMDVFTETEKQRFRVAISNYGKDFEAIAEALKPRTRGEVVQFYYLWKQTPDFHNWNMEEYKRKRARPTFSAVDES